MESSRYLLQQFPLVYQHRQHTTADLFTLSSFNCFEVRQHLTFLASSSSKFSFFLTSLTSLLLIPLVISYVLWLILWYFIFPNSKYKCYLILFSFFLFFSSLISTDNFNHVSNFFLLRHFYRWLPNFQFQAIPKPLNSNPWLCDKHCHLHCPWHF